MGQFKDFLFDGMHIIRVHRKVRLQLSLEDQILNTFLNRVLGYLDEKRHIHSSEDVGVESVVNMLQASDGPTQRFEVVVQIIDYEVVRAVRCQVVPPLNVYYGLKRLTRGLEVRVQHSVDQSTVELKDRLAVDPKARMGNLPQLLLLSQLG